MTAVAELPLAPLAAPPRSSRSRLTDHLREYRTRPFIITTLFALANATAFMIIRPGVNDLWAARARASAASHGVGLTYWFSWFGGGSTPGNYSVLTPYLSAWISAELVGALSAVAIPVLVAVALRGTKHPHAATAVAAVAAGINLWSGRVPFLLGAAIAVGAIIAVRAHRPVIAAIITVASIAASPVSPAFLALGLAGTFISSPKYRKISASTIGVVVLGFGLVALAFGTPGPQHFAPDLCIESLIALVAFLVARTPEYVRTIVWLSMITVVVMYLVPNGMGSNFGRMIWFCLPVLIVATSKWPAWFALVLVAPVVLSGANLTVSDLRQAGDPASDRAYYEPLAQELDNISGLNSYRLEVVSQKAHAAYDALLDHAMLARGWETQEDNALNRVVRRGDLNPTSFKIWIDNNSVGYIALPLSKVEKFTEYRLVAGGTLPFLHKVWSSPTWALYKVDNAVPMIVAPQQILSYTQSTLVVRASCACTFSLRIRYSKYLRASAVVPKGTSKSDAGTATLTSDGYGFTTVTTTAPGDYSLHGSVSRLFH